MPETELVRENANGVPAFSPGLVQRSGPTLGKEFTIRPTLKGISAKVPVAGARSIAPRENLDELAEQCSALRLRRCFLQRSPLGLWIILGTRPRVGACAPILGWETEHRWCSRRFWSAAVSRTAGSAAASIVLRWRRIDSERAWVSFCCCDWSGGHSALRLRRRPHRKRLRRPQPRLHLRGDGGLQGV